MCREIHSGRHSWDAKRQRLVLLRREHRHLRALRPGPSSRDHLQVPRAFPLRRYLPKARVSLELPLRATDVGSPVATV